MAAMTTEPYPGLRPFLRDETDIFFGRERQIDRMIEQLREHRFLAVTGTSGSGKSSLVRTGLLSALELGFLDAAGGNWRIVDIRPGSKPMDVLASSLLEAMQLSTTPTDIALTRAALERGPLSIANFLHRIPGATNENLLILVDQFEEIFRFINWETSNEAEAFVSLLMGSVSQTDAPIYVVLTMRSDFLGDCAQFEGLPELINRSQYLTPRLSRHDYQRVIEEPARVFGGHVAPGVTSRLLNDMVNIPDQLCVVQHALLMMWRRARRRPGKPVEIRVEDYEAIGGLSEALSRHAEEVLEDIELPEKQETNLAPQELSGLVEKPKTIDKYEIAERMFRCLTEGSGRGSDVRRPTRFAELLQVTRADEKDLRAIIDAFRAPGSNFLMPPPSIPIKDSTIIDISHESLIRGWKRLKAWSLKEFESAVMYRRIEQTAKLWIEGRAALWSSPDLERALLWRSEQDPSQPWAKRYGNDFDTALTFLDASRTAERRSRHRRRAIVAAGIAVPLLLIGLVYNNVVDKNQKHILAQALDSAEAWKAKAIASQFNGILTTAETALENWRLDEARATALMGRQLMTAREANISRAQRYWDTLVGSLRPYGRELYVADGDTVSRENTFAEYANDGNTIAWISNNNEVVITDASTGATVRRLLHKTDEVRGLTLSADGKFLALFGQGPKIELISVSSGTLANSTAAVANHHIKAAAFAETSRGTILAGVGQDGELRAWRIHPDTDNVELLPNFQKSDMAFRDAEDVEERVAITCSRNRCAIFGPDDRLKVYDVEDVVRMIATSQQIEATASDRGKPIGAQKIVLTSKGMLLRRGDRWVSYVINEADQSIEQADTVTIDDSFWPVLAAHDDDALLAIQKLDNGRSRVLSLSGSGDQTHSQTIGISNSEAVIAISPAADSVLAIDEEHRHGDVLKIVRFESPDSQPCEGGCPNLLVSRGEAIYAANEDALFRFDLERRQFIPIPIDFATVSKSQQDNIRVLGLQADPGADRLYLLYSYRTAKPDGSDIGLSRTRQVDQRELGVAVFDVDKNKLVILQSSKSSAGSELPDLRRALAQDGLKGASKSPILVTESTDTSRSGSPPSGALIWPAGSEGGVEQSGVVFFAPSRAKMLGKAGIILDMQRSVLSVIVAGDGAPQRGAAIRSLPTYGYVADFGFLNSSDRFYLAYRTGLVEIWDSSQSDLRRIGAINTKIESLQAISWSASFREFAVVGGAARTSIRWFDLNSGALLQAHDHNRRIDAVQFLKGTETLLISADRVVVMPSVEIFDKEADLSRYAMAITPQWYTESDIPKGSSLILPSLAVARPGDFAAVLADCEIPAQSEIFRSTVGGQTDIPAYGTGGERRWVATARPLRGDLQ
jgi:WD40 repeat protein